ncbi:MAG: UbiA family prenyltransferase, partial [Bacteroidota bacterium]
MYFIAGRRLDHWDWPLLGFTLLACLAANVYITGLNQITDVEIDRINKPYLPLASEAYSMQTGKMIVMICLLISLVVAAFFRPYLLATVLLSLLLGTAYSLPPVRLKRFYFWAAFCILAVRGLIVNLLLYLHFQYSLGGGHRIPAVI